MRFPNPWTVRHRGRCRHHAAADWFGWLFGRPKKSASRLAKCYGKGIWNIDSVAKKKKTVVCVFVFHQVDMGNNSNNKNSY